MVGLLLPSRHAALRSHEGRRTPGRTLPDRDVDHFGYTNIKTILPRRTLLEGYRRVIATSVFARAVLREGFPDPDATQASCLISEGVAHLLVELRRISRFLVKPGLQSSRPVRALSVVAAGGAPEKPAARVSESLDLRFVFRICERAPTSLPGRLNCWCSAATFTDSRWTRPPQLDAELAGMEQPLEQSAPLSLAGEASARPDDHSRHCDRASIRLQWFIYAIASRRLNPDSCFFLTSSETFRPDYLIGPGAPRTFARRPARRCRSDLADRPVSARCP